MDINCPWEETKHMLEQMTFGKSELQKVCKKQISLVNLEDWTEKTNQKQTKMAQMWWRRTQNATAC